MKATLVALLVFLVACPSKEEAERQAEDIAIDIDAKMISDAITQYRMVQRDGDRMQMCLRAGLVAEVYLQASVKLESEYRKWRAVEKKDCKRAGMSR